MEVVNLTSFAPAAFSCKLSSAHYSCVFIIKASFYFGEDGQLLLVDESDPPTGDMFVYDDPDKSVIYESDFAPFKPKADLIFSGSCHAPGNRPVNACEVIFQVGNHGKGLYIIGDRYWMRNSLGSWLMSDSVPFSEMELVYENSFGGPGFKDNPHGKGAGKIEDEQGRQFWPLPNIEDPDHLIKTIKDRPQPAGFAPLGRTWPLRMTDRVGTYGDVWLRERWPWFPEDFDWSYFNSAPSELQVDGYLKGDEPVFLKNLHPEQPDFHFNLPGIRPRFFVCERTSEEECSFDEVQLRLDTLWVDMNHEKVHLIWRGNRPVKSEKFEELDYCFIASENLEEAPKSLEYYQELFLRSRDEEDEDMVGAEADVIPTMDDSWIGELEEKFVLMEKEFEKLDAQMAEAEKRATAMLKDAGIDPAKLKEAEEASSKLSIKDILVKEAGRHEKMLKQIAKEHPELAAKLPPPMSPDEIEEINEAFKFEPMPEFEPFAEPLSRQNCQDRLERGEGLAGEDLSNLDLSGLDFSGADCRQAVFEGANLAGSVFERADLSGAVLSGCNLSGINLRAADLSGVEAAGADFSAADLAMAVLDHADLTGCNMREACLEQIHAFSTMFTGSDLSNARMTKAMLRESDLEKVVLEGAVLEGAVLTDASVEGARGKGIDMKGADLTGLHAGDAPDFSGGIFIDARGDGSVWEGALLEGADFRSVSMEGANFMEAVLISANFTGADLSTARFDNADLTGTLMTFANLFKACFAGALMIDTDFRGANMYEAEFYNARIGEVHFEGTNLKMTKLANWKTSRAWKS